MRIERVDEKTVKCFISNEELDAYEITYKDFVVRSDKAREVVEEIIEQAEEEVGYQPPKYAFDLQVMLLPDKGMILTFSEKDPTENELFGELLESLKEIKNLTTHSDGEKRQIAFADKEDIQQGKGAEKAPDFAVFVFDSLRQIYDYASVLPTNLRIHSLLYQMDDSYYLCIKKGTAAYSKYSRACIQAMEFGRLHTADKKQMEYLEEHGTCLIQEHALKKLR